MQSDGNELILASFKSNLCTLRIFLLLKNMVSLPRRYLRRFEAWDLLDLGCSKAWDIFRLGTFWIWDVLRLGMF
jgi:hypothetical protein